MAKRFTDTDKFKKPFYRGLQGAYKLLWNYICDDCDHAGIWQVDFEVAQIRIGYDMKISESDAIKFFAGRIISFSGGSKWFIPSFIEFQYGTLNETNRAHNSVITLLKKNNLWKGNKPLTSPLQGAKDKDKELDKDKDLEKDKEPDTDKPKTRIQKCGDVWSEFMLEATQSEFKWEGKEMAGLKGIVAHIEEKLQNGGTEVTDENVTGAWRWFLQSRPKWPAWLIDKWELTMINSKFNEIYTHVKTHGTKSRKPANGAESLDPQIIADNIRKSAEERFGKPKE